MKPVRVWESSFMERRALSLWDINTSRLNNLFFLVFREYEPKYAVVINSKSTDITFTLSRSTNAN
jgi:hypothetical protein